MTLREYLEKTTSESRKFPCEFCGETLYDRCGIPVGEAAIDGDGNRHVPPGASEYDRGWNDCRDAILRKFNHVPTWHLPDWLKAERRSSCRKEPIWMPIQCRRCGACEEHCCCVRSNFRTVEFVDCFDCLADENRPRNELSERTWEDEVDDEASRGPHGEPPPGMEGRA